MVATLKAKVEPTKAPNVTAPHHPLHDCLAFPTHLTIFRKHHFFFRDARLPTPVDQFATIVAMLFTALFAEVNGFLLLQRLYEEPLFTFFAFFYTEHPREIAQNCIDSSFQAIIQAMVYAPWRMVQDMLTTLLCAFDELVLLKLGHHMTRQAFLTEVMLASDGCELFGRSHEQTNRTDLQLLL